MKMNKLAIFLISALSVMIFPVYTRAVDSESILGFTYENVLPKNQIGDNTFFELKVKPNTEQIVKTKISNLTNEEKTIKITVSNATSSSVGSINYGVNKEDLVGEKTISIKDIIEYPNQVKLKANEEKIVEFKLKIPKKKFEGIILGGIHLKEVNKTKVEKKVKGSSLNSEYSYIYSISLQESEKKIEPEFTSSGTKFNGMAYININNIKSTIASNIAISSILMKDDNDKVINDISVENYRMAPNSRLKLPFEGTEDLSIGKYRTVTTVKNDKKEWKFTSDFEVTEKNKKASEMLFDDTLEEKTFNPVFLVILIISFISTVGLIYFYLERKKNKK